MRVVVVIIIPGSITMVERAIMEARNLLEQSILHPLLLVALERCALGLPLSGLGTLAQLMTREI
jgi:hypothetical protein